MSGPPRIRPMNVTDTESRPVLVSAGNKARNIETGKPGQKPVKNVEKGIHETEMKEKKGLTHSSGQCVSVPIILRKQEHRLAKLNVSMSASCSSDASSTDSSTHSPSGKMVGRTGMPVRKKQSGPKLEKVKVGSDDMLTAENAVTHSFVSLDHKKRCAWVTPNTDPFCVAFHDEEWGVPVHDDKKLFELLSLSGALADLSWPAILSKRQLLREIFMDFDPSSVSLLNEKKKASSGGPATSLLSELRLRAIIENARHVCKVINEFGSFNAFIWSFVNHKPIINQFRYPRQVPVKSPKADSISKELVRRGFRSVSPTVVYTFMQVAGLTNDHLITCFRFKECVATAEFVEKDNSAKSLVKDQAMEETNDVGLAMGGLSFSS